MEPAVFPALSEYFTLGGDPAPIIDGLSSNYVGTPQVRDGGWDGRRRGRGVQMCNLVGEWLVESGLETEAVARLFESSLSALLTKHFNSKKADAIFEQADNTGIGSGPHRPVFLFSAPTWIESGCRI